MNERLIQTQKLYQILDLESFILISIMGIISFLFYRFFLKAASEERHQNLKAHFKALLKYFISMTIAYCLYFLATQGAEEADIIKRLLPYFGLITLLLGAVFFVKTSRLLVLQYLFLGSMKAGVPLLLVNIFSLVLSILIGFWTVNTIFGVQLTPLLATSTAFSIILGLALQDTLGNLFAGISMQVDKTFEIGDWLEVQNGLVKIIGQVKEISWRSTVLVGLSDEVITLPNKLISQCQISNFSPEGHPIVRSHLFKFSFSTEAHKVLEILEQAASQISDVRGIPAPFAYTQETNDYGFSVKLIYFIENYGRQFTIGDKVVRKAMDLLKQNGIECAKPSLNIHQTN